MHKYHLYSIHGPILILNFDTLNLWFHSTRFVATTFCQQHQTTLSIIYNQLFNYQQQEQAFMSTNLVKFVGDSAKHVLSLFFQKQY